MIAKGGGGKERSEKERKEGERDVRMREEKDEQSDGKKGEQRWRDRE